MSSLIATTFRLEENIVEGLRLVKERDGIPVSEQVRRALRAWLEERGVQKTERKRAATRKRA
jgi:Arc/MetJ-type ribon-helix-helix transcriptional regulator